MRSYPAVDESFDRLYRAGWSVGEVATAGEWIVTGTNGENLLEAGGRTQAEAWSRACEQARAVGTLACSAGWRGSATAQGLLAVNPRFRYNILLRSENTDQG